MLDFATSSSRIVECVGFGERLSVLHGYRPKVDMLRRWKRIFQMLPLLLVILLVGAHSESVPKRNEVSWKVGTFCCEFIALKDGRFILERLALTLHACGCADGPTQS